MTPGAGASAGEGPGHDLRGGRVLFVSDVHLTPLEPAIFAGFCRFLDTEAPGARALYVLGDLFDFWVGRRQNRLPGYAEVFRRLRAIRDGGTTVGFVPGNRDFLLEGAFASSQGLSVLPDVAEILLDGRRLCLTHGDLLCTRDEAYHRMRRFLRSRLARALMGLLPLPVALRLAGGLRWASVMEVARKTHYELTLDFAEARRWAARGYDAIVCGHVHRGERYRLALPDRSADLVVLPGWDVVPGYAEWTEGEVRLRSFPMGK